MPVTINFFNNLFTWFQIGKKIIYDSWRTIIIVYLNCLYFSANGDESSSSSSSKMAASSVSAASSSAAAKSSSSAMSSDSSSGYASSGYSSGSSSGGYAAPEPYNETRMHPAHDEYNGTSFFHKFFSILNLNSNRWVYDVVQCTFVQYINNILHNGYNKK